MNIATNLNNMVNSARIENLVSQVDPNEEKLVNMRVKGNRYYGYTTITDPTTGKRKQVEFALGVGIGELQHKSKAYKEYGKKLEQIERGELPNNKNLSFHAIAVGWKRNPVCLLGIKHGSFANILILDKTLSPYFDKIKIKDINDDRVKSYLAYRESKGIKASTLDKETRILKWVMRSVSKTWVLPYWEGKNKEKEKLGAPTPREVALMLSEVAGCSPSYGDQYQDIASIMAYTGLDTSDVLKLSRSSLVDGCIEGRRGKTGKKFKVGIAGGLETILSRLLKVISLDPCSSFFSIPTAHCASQAIKRAFRRSGNKIFHAKSLRDYYASQLYNQKESDNFIQDSLGQTRGSKHTRKYTFASKERLENVAKKLPDFQNLIPIKREANQ